MTSSQINAYTSTMSTNSASKSSSSSSTSSTQSQTVKTTDFLSLLAKQMSCQDPMNPTDNTQYLSELAQFSALQMSENQLSSQQDAVDTLNTLLGVQYIQYGASLVGKTVEVETTDSNKQTQKVQGVVSSVDYSSMDGNTNVYNLVIDGKSYPVTAIKQVIGTAK